MHSTLHRGSWALCDGQLLPINQNQALFSILGTTYGGNGTTTFALPDLRGRSPVHAGQGPGLASIQLGQAAGEENHTLISSEMPSHTHPVKGDAANASASTPTGNVWAASANNPFSSSAPNAALNPASVGAAGGSQPHPNLQPYTVVNFVIALDGDLPLAQLGCGRTCRWRHSAGTKEKTMSDPFIAEIRMFGGNFAPRGWAFCNGQLLSIAQNTALFSLLGTTYGGNGQTTFGLPDLQGRSPMHQGQGPGLTPRVLGETSGQENVTLLASQMPAHTHQPQADASGGGQTSPANATWGAGGRGRPPAYAANPAPAAALSPQALAPTGGSQPHNNRSPYLGVSFIIALQGIFPSRN